MWLTLNSETQQIYQIMEVIAVRVIEMVREWNKCIGSIKLIETMERASGHFSVIMVAYFISV